MIDRQMPTKASNENNIMIWMLLPDQLENRIPFNTYIQI